MAPPSTGTTAAAAAAAAAAASSDTPAPSRPSRTAKSKSQPPAESPLSILAPNFVLHPSSVGLGASLAPPTASASASSAPTAAAVTRTSIYSLDIHPDGTRLATGGNDHFIRLWSLAAITSPALHAADADPAHAKERFAAKRHDGGVMCVRWSNVSGELLASGADDGSLVIWYLNKNKPVTVPGMLVGASGPVTYPESLTFARKLPSMASDVIDLAWAHDNKYLAACSLDNAVVVFDGVTFDRVARCLHSSFVKGLAFDPVGTYLVSQSDDGTARFWNTATWAADTTVTHPFLQDTGSAAVLVRRPSFSPDGSYVGVANAVSNGVHVAAVLPRARPTYPSKTMYLVGHSAPICVAKFAPVMVSLNGTANAKPSAVIALGSNDRKISVWLLSTQQACLVLDAAVESDVTDLTWSPDGRVLLASSHEGRVVGVQMPEDLRVVGGPAVGRDVVEALLVKNGRQPDRAGVVDQSQVGALVGPSQMAGGAGGMVGVAAGMGGGSSPTMTPQRVTTTKDGRKRIQPMLVAAFAPLPGTQSAAAAFSSSPRPGSAHAPPAPPRAAGQLEDRDRDRAPRRPIGPTSALHPPRSRLTMTPPHVSHRLSSPAPRPAWPLRPLIPAHSDGRTSTFTSAAGDVHVTVTQHASPVYLSVAHDSDAARPMLANVVLDAPVHAMYVREAHVALVTCKATFMVLDLWMRKVVVRASLDGVVGAGGDEAEDEDVVVELETDPRNPVGMPLVVAGENCVVKWDAGAEGFVGVEVDSE